MTPENHHAPKQDLISVGEWVLYLFLLALPLVNIILLVVWAFGSEPNLTKKNFAKSSLIWIAIGIEIMLLMMFLIYILYRTRYVFRLKPAVISYYGPYLSNSESARH